MSKCTCFDDLRDKAMEEYADRNELDCKWRNGVFWLNGKDNAPMKLVLDLSWRDTKKDGTPYKNKTNDYLSVRMRFCPMCGRKYKEND